MPRPTHSAATTAVAAGNPHTVAAAMRCFEQGGNAVDAAIAAGLASFVAEPLLASAGGGGLMLIAHPDGETECLEFFPRAPGLGLGGEQGPGVDVDFAGVDVDFGSATQRFYVGRASACAPCVLPAFADAAIRYGRLPLTALVEPAVELGHAGVELGPSGAEVFDLLRPIIGRDPDTLRALLGGDTQLSASTRTHNPRFAAYLDRWAARGGEELDADREALLASFGREAGGSLSPEDLDAAQPRWSTPGQAKMGAWTLSSCPLPGGVAVAGMARALASLRAEAPEAELALALAHAGVQADRARLGSRPRGSTTHISTLDGEGRMVSMTLSNGEGCGHILKHSGMLLNNFMGEADLNPAGHFQHPAGTPLPTMMSPCIARGPSHLLALGSGGANRIRSAVTRVFDALAHRDAALVEAILSPRVHAEGDEVWFERGRWRDAVAVEQALRSAYAKVHPFEGSSFFFGGVHCVLRGPTGVQACGDPRRAGACATR